MSARAVAIHGNHGLQGNGEGRELEMAEQGKFAVVAGRKPVARAVEQVREMGAVREATTGRVVTLPRVWAVAAAPVRVKQEVAGEAARPAVEAKGERVQAVPAGEVGFYRKYTEAMLRRYVQMTMEAGRVPSMMGREVLGGRASSYRIHGFDDAVNFRLDMEKCLKQLNLAEREVVRRVAMQEYTQAEAAGLLGVSLRTVVSRYGKALDRLTGILLATRLLEPMRVCQAAASARRSVTV